MAQEPEPEPLEQLQLVHAELNRQRESTSEKHRTMYQRASLLIGAATIVTGVQAARIPVAVMRVHDEVVTSKAVDWAAAVPLLAAVLAIGATTLALVAAIQGIRKTGA